MGTQSEIRKEIFGALEEVKKALPKGYWTWIDESKGHNFVFYYIAVGSTADIRDERTILGFYVTTPLENMQSKDRILTAEITKEYGDIIDTGPPSETCDKDDVNNIILTGKNMINYLKFRLLEYLGG